MSQKITINGQEYQVPSDVPVTVGSPYTTSSHTIRGKITSQNWGGQATTSSINTSSINTSSPGAWTLGHSNNTINSSYPDPLQQVEQLKQLLKSDQISMEDLEFLLKDIRYSNRLKQIYSVVNTNMQSSHFGLSEDVISKAMVDYEIEKLIEE